MAGWIGVFTMPQEMAVCSIILCIYLVYLGDAVPTVGLVGWALLLNGAGLIALLPRGRVNHRDR